MGNGIDSLSPEVVLALARQAPDAMLFTDTDGIIRFWNAAAERVFGHAEQAALGQSLDIIVPERFRDAHWQGFHRAVAERATQYVGQALATRSARADGTAIYVELSFAIVLNDTGEVIGVLSHARDITERFEKERADRKRLQELTEALADKS